MELFFKKLFKAKEEKEVIPLEKIYGLLGNHDRFSFLEEHNINNINGKYV